MFSAVTPDLVFISLIDALVYGALLAAVAVSLTLVFGLGRVVNFAVGAFYALGAYVTFTLRPDLGFWLAIICAALAVGALGAAMDRVALRPLRNRGEIDTILLTFGAAILINGVIQVIWGTATHTQANPVGGRVTLFGQTMSIYLFVAATVAVVVSGFVWSFLRSSATGRSLRGASQNLPMAELLGYNTNRMMTGLFAFSAAMAALVGGLATPIFSVRPEMGVDFLIDAFLAVVIGGLGSVRGAIVGAFTVALVKNLSLIFFTAEVATALSFTIVVAILLVSPRGIFREGRAIA